VTRSEPPSPGPRGPGPGIVALGLAFVALALVTEGSIVVGLGIAAAGIVGGTILLRRPGRSARATAPLPVVAAAAVLAGRAPLGAIPELLAGTAALAVLVWLSDDPRRPPAGVRRGVWGWLIPAVAVAIAWTSTGLLPSDAASLGVAAGALVAAVGALAYLSARPELLEPDRAPTL
jgi:hypothetical protein